MTANNSSYTVGAEDTDAQIYACSDRLNTNMQKRYRRVAASQIFQKGVVSGS